MEETTNVTDAALEAAGDDALANDLGDAAENKGSSAIYAEGYE